MIIRKVSRLAAPRYAWAVRYSSNITQDVKSVNSVQRLYLNDSSTPGSTFFLPHGARVFNKLIGFMRAQQQKFGFQEVITPIIYKDSLWKQSGHWDHYRKDMFEVFGAQHGEHTECSEIEEGGRNFSLKPMNCPGHCVMFSRLEHSFRDLPVRYSDFSPLHRNEASGALSGLTRVRKFHQDDGHIFCRHDQVQQEIQSCLKMLHNVYSVFGLSDYRLTLSTRPEQYIGTEQLWDQAEADLASALDSTGKPWTRNEGDGAFYGPKIDVMVRDNTGKEHQLATIQLDFQLPKKFDLSYIGSELGGGASTRPVLIHRAIFGSLERFLAILIDHFEGNWPFWLNPRQACIIPVSNDKHLSYANEIYKQLSGVSHNLDKVSPVSDRSFYVEIAAENEPVPVRIKRAVEKGYAYILMVGDRELESSTVAVRTRQSRKTESMTPSEIAAKFAQLEDSYL